MCCRTDNDGRVQAYPAHTTSTWWWWVPYWRLGWYEPLVEFAGAGASVPISSFGNALVKGAGGI